MELLGLFFSALYDLSNAMAPYILFGLLFAGILHELVPTTFVERHLGSDNVGSVVKATLFGVPLPVCSCGVIPLATAIKKNGASNGATLSFLISTPITGVDSILATFGMFGWAFTLYRVVTSMLIAVAAGIVNNFAAVETVKEPEPKPAFSLGSPSGFSPAQPVAFASASLAQEGCGEGCGCEHEREAKKSFSISAALRYGFVTLLDDIAKPLFWGLIVGAAITAAVPENLSEMISGNLWLGYLIVIAVAVPMYVCATASLPIAAALILSGVSAGAAFVFLSAGPATNTVTIGVVKKMLGARSLAIYLATIILGSLLFGLGLDLFFAQIDLDMKSIVRLEEEAGLIAVGSSVILWGLTLYFLLRPFFAKKEKKCCSGGSCCGT
jgi:uncharacterized membrane protein YraQ (UPF0718 family)